MGIRDTMNKLADEQRERSAASQAAAATATAGCPDPGTHYEPEVNKGSINMGMFGGKLTQRYRTGYRLAHLIEQDGNTIMVWEHNHP